MASATDRITKYLSLGATTIRDAEGRLWDNLGDVHLAGEITDRNRSRLVWTLEDGLAGDGITIAAGAAVLDVQSPSGVVSRATRAKDERGQRAQTFQVVPGLGGQGLSLTTTYRGQQLFLVSSASGTKVMAEADDGSASFKLRATLFFDRSADRDPLKHLTMARFCTPWSTLDGAPYWEWSCTPKVSEHVRIYDVAICKEGAKTGRTSSSIEVYKFDDSFFSPPAGARWVDHRERYLVTRVFFELDTFMSKDADGNEREVKWMNSRVVLPALQQAMSALISDARASGELQQFGINYSGHGDPNGMFEGALDPEDDEAFLAHVVAELGHRIDLLDWGSNCNVATYENLSNQAAYADYIVASDLALACTVHNGDYTALVQPGQPFRDTVLRALAVDEAHYGNQAELIRERNFSESVHAFDARRFVDLAAHADLDAADDKTMLAGNEDCAHFYNGGKNRVGDVLCYLRKHAPAATEIYESMRFASVDSREYHWNPEYDEANGLILWKWLWA